MASWDLLDILALFYVPLWGSIGIALLAGPLGALLVWQRLSYLGDALAHASVLGVGLGMFFAWPLLPTTLVVTLSLSLLLYTFLGPKRLDPAESMLLLLTQGFMGLGLLLMTCTRLSSLDLMGYLMGDFLMISSQEALLIWILLGGAGLLLWQYWKPLLATIVHPELAAIAGVPSGTVQLCFLLVATLILVFVVQATGVLLVTTLLIFPVLSLRPWISNPKSLCLASSFLGLLSVLSGLGGSLLWDAPPGPLIAVFLFVCFLGTRLLLFVRREFV
jgi:zinc transport system permease protein